MFICSRCVTRYETWWLHVNRNLQLWRLQDTCGFSMAHFW